MNVNELKGVIVAREKNYQMCAEHIGLSNSGFNSRIRNENFRVSEIEKLSLYLEIDKIDDFMKIFFPNLRLK